MIDTALSAVGERPLARTRLLAAQVEITLSAGDPDRAERAVEELEQVAAGYSTAGLAGLAAQARGALLVNRGRPAQALPILHGAWRTWQDLGAPYLAARVRLLVAQAHTMLGDRSGAANASQAAGEVLARLGAAQDARPVPDPGSARSRPDGLTARETQVLTLVAEGRTNQQIGDALSISHKTVARHLSNIFTKCGLTTRTAAAAYAYTHGLTATDGR